MIPHEPGNALVVRDLDRNGEPEVLLRLVRGGTRCCAWLRVYRFDRSSRPSTARNPRLANLSAGYRIDDLDGDGRPELIGRDDRFRRLSDYASGPTRIRWYDRGRFRDATPRFPEHVARDARAAWRIDVRHRGRPREAVASWVATESLFGRRRAAGRALARLRRGELRAGLDGPPGARAYVREPKRFLRTSGYLG